MKKLASTVSLILFCSQIGPWPVRAASNDYATLHSEAITRYREGAYEEAIGMYKQLVKMAPEDIEVRKDLMWVLWKEEHFDEAAQVAHEVLKMDPNDKEATSLIEKAPALGLRAKANNYFRAGKYEAANKVYRQLAEQDPKNVAILRDLMWSLWQTEHYEEVRGVANKILALRKDDKEALDMIQRSKTAETRADAVKNYRNGRFVEAADRYKQLLDQNPNNLGLLKDMYWSLWQTGRFQELVPISEQITKLSPNDAEAWNLLGRSLVANNKIEEGLKAYEKSLALKPNQPDTERVVGRLKVDLRQFDEAIGILSDVEKKDPSIKTVYPQLAKAQFFKGLYEESASNWAKAVELFPENDNYKLHEARTEYYSGRISTSLTKLKKLASNPGPMRMLATDFLVDDAICNNDFVTAEKYLEKFAASGLSPQEEPHLMKLATIYETNGKLKKCIQTIDKFLKLNPNNIPAMLMKADILFDHKRYTDAIRIYHKVQRINPYSPRPYDGIANAEFGRGQPNKAVKVYQNVIDLDPTNPYGIITKAHFLNESGRSAEAEVLLLDWLKNNPDQTVVPILLYHGVTEFNRDPMLAYPVHLTLRIFKDQMAGIKNAGYTPITTDDLLAWYYKDKPLPKKPILITFDDGRLDNFRFADPVLQKYNLKATMFVPIANVEGHLPPSYVSWDQINQYQNTGRWEFQAHGDLGHSRIQIDQVGHEGLFLVNRMWLDDKKRLETIDEWKKRILEDHKNGQNKIAQRTGKTPLAFAFPEGTFGQIDQTNSAQAVPVNMEQVRKVYKLAFYQDSNGINVKSRDPLFLTRIEPHNDWSGEDLVRHLQDKSPYVIMYRKLLSQAAWEGRPRAAFTYLESLKKTSASQLVLLGEEGKIRSSLGDYYGTQKLIDQDHNTDRDKETQRMVDALKRQKKPVIVPGYTYSEDNKKRISSLLDGAFYPFPAAPVNTGLIYRNGLYKEENFPSIRQNAAGLSLLKNFNLYHTVSAKGMYHWLKTDSTDKKIGNTYTASLGWTAHWTDSTETELQGGRDLYDTARAMNAEITEDYANFYGLWKPRGPWQLSGKLQGADLSDGNNRMGLQASVSRHLFLSVRAAYKYTTDHMKNMSNDYYSPQHLQQHQFGVEVNPDFGWFEPQIAYYPGIGKEDGLKQQFVQDVEVSLRFRVTPQLFFEPFYSLIDTPTYRRNTFNAILNYRF